MGRLTKEQIQFYQHNGFIKLTDIFTEEEKKLISSEYDRIFTIKNNNDMETSWIGNDMKKVALDKDYTVTAVHNLQYHSQVFAKLIYNDKLLDALEDIMQTPNILLHHTKAHFKPPRKGAPYLMHQDYHYFPFKNDSMVAAFVHVDKSSPENGGLCVYPGSHKLGPLKDAGFVKDGVAYHYADPEKYPLEKATPVLAEQGDVVVFSYLLLHGSYMNLSERTRRMFLMQVMDADDEPLQDIHVNPGRGLVLRGRNDNLKANMSDRFLH